ncbi:MAG: non-homologous end-joining DNA ligase [Mycobacteriales bacterium]
MAAPLAPMLAVSGALPTDDAAWSYEVKWDGVRVLAEVSGERLILHSRNGNDVTAVYPELAGMAAAVGRDAVLDGEVVAFDRHGRSNFGLLQERMHVRNPSAALLASTPVQLLLFDLLRLDGQDSQSLSYDERRELLTSLALEGESWSVPPAFPVGRDLLEATRAQGLEGVMAKRRDSRYLPGRRSAAWLKVKNIRRASVVIAGWKPGEGGRAGRIGSLLLGVQGESGLEFAGHVGTGFTEATLARLGELLTPLQRTDSPFPTAVPRLHAKAAVWVEPVLVAEVDYTEWTREGRLRHPSYKGLRDDIDPQDVTRT